MGETDKTKGNRSRARAANEQAQGEAANEATDAPEATAPEGTDEGGAQTPPAPPAPTDDAPEASGETYSKDLLISRADRLLGYSPVLARGVLAEADEEMTIDQAKSRIQEFLDREVAVTEEG